MKRNDAEDREPAWLDIIRKQVETLHFGVVQVVVHEGRVVQVERTEKLRLNRSATEDSGT